MAGLLFCERRRHGSALSNACFRPGADIAVTCSPLMSIRLRSEQNRQRNQEANDYALHRPRGARLPPNQSACHEGSERKMKEKQTGERCEQARMRVAGCGMQRHGEQIDGSHSGRERYEIVAASQRRMGPHTSFISATHVRLGSKAEPGTAARPAPHPMSAIGQERSVHGAQEPHRKVAST